MYAPSKDYVPNRQFSLDVLDFFDDTNYWNGQYHQNGQCHGNAPAGQCHQNTPAGDPDNGQNGLVPVFNNLGAFLDTNDPVRSDDLGSFLDTITEGIDVDDNGRSPEDRNHSENQNLHSSENRPDTLKDRPDTSKDDAAQKLQKTCRVCGDKALGYNFSVVTCESCKAFFRRNATKKKGLRCPFEENCTITVKSRRYCPKCRLRKCFEVGMRPECIQSEQQLAERRMRQASQKAVKNNITGLFEHGFEDIDGSERSISTDPRHGHQSLYKSISTASSESDSNGLGMRLPGKMNGHWTPPEMYSTVYPHPTTDCTRVSLSPTDQDAFVSIRVPKSALKINASAVGTVFNGVDQSIQSAPIVSAGMRSVAPGQSPGWNCAVPYEDRQWREVDNVHQVLEPQQANQFPAYSSNNNDQALSVYSPTSANYQSVQSWTSPSPVSPSTYLELRYAKLGEILLANEEWSAARRLGMDVPRAFPPPKPKSKDITTTTFCFLDCVAKQHKRLTAFQSLHPTDQWALMSAVAHDMIILRMISRCSVPEGQMKMCTKFKERFGHDRTQKWTDLLAAYPMKWRTNETVMLLLSALVLFNPDRVPLQNKASVLEQQLMYRRLLQDYLKSAYGEPEAQQAYFHLLNQIQTLGDWVAKNALKIAYELNPDTLEPVYIHVTPLHHHCHKKALE